MSEKSQVVGLANRRGGNNLTIPFEKAGFVHHAIVGKAPDAANSFYKAAVTVGNAVLPPVGFVMGLTGR